jgi:hypothetical protein
VVKVKDALRQNHVTTSGILILEKRFGTERRESTIHDSKIVKQAVTTERVHTANREPKAS